MFAVEHVRSLLLTLAEADSADVTREPQCNDTLRDIAQIHARVVTSPRTLPARYGAHHGRLQQTNKSIIKLSKFFLPKNLTLLTGASNLSGARNLACCYEFQV